MRPVLRRLGRYLLRFLGVLLTTLTALPMLLLIALTGAVLFANTPTGQRTIAQLASANVPGLTIEGLSGPLPSGLGVSRLTMADSKGVWLTLEDARIGLDFAALARREARVELVSARLVRVDRAPESQPAPQPEPDTSSGGFSIPHLPVAVRLDKLALDRVELGQALAGQAAALQLQGSAGLVDGAARAQLALHQLDTPGKLNLDLDANLNGERLDAKAKLREAANGLIAGMVGLRDRPTALDLSLSGPASGAELTLDASMGPDITLHTDGTVHAALDGSAGGRLQGRLTGGPLLPENIRPIVPGVDFLADAEFSHDQVVTLREARVALPAGTVRASGTVGLPTQSLDVKVALALNNAETLRPLVPAGIGWQRWQADAAITGTFALPHIALEARPDGFTSGVPAADAALGGAPVISFAGTPEQVEHLTLKGRRADLAASGRVADPLDAKFTLDVRDLAGLQPGTAGTLHASGTATGSRNDPTLDVQLDGRGLVVSGQDLGSPHLALHVEHPATALAAQADIRGQYRNLPLVAALRANPDGRQIRIDQGDIRFGPATLTVTGSFNQDTKVFAGPVRLAVSDLRPLARLGGQDIGGRLTLNADLGANAAGKQQLDAKLDAPALAIPGGNGRLLATARGTLDDLQFGLDGAGMGATAALRGQVETGNEGRRIALSQLQLAAKGESIRAAGPVRVLLRNDGGVAVEQATLTTSRGGSVRANGNWGPSRADLRLVIDRLPAALAAAFVPNTPLQGTLGADLRVSGTTAAPEVQGNVRADGIMVSAPWSRGLPNVDLRAEIRASAKAAQLAATVNAGRSTQLRATARLPNGFGSNAPVSATLDGNADLAPLAAPFLAAGADRFTGRLNLALRVNGSIGAPQIGGQATLANGDYRNLAYGVHVTDLGGTVSAAGGTRLGIRLGAKTGGNGTMNVSGSVDPMAPNIPMDLTITARNAAPVQSDLGTGAFNADLRATGEATGASSITGTIRLLHAEIQIPEHLPGSVRTLPVRETGRLPPNAYRPPAPPPAPAVTAPAPPINLDIQFQAPQGVFIRGRGIEVELGGALHITGTAAAPSIEGALNLRRGTIDIVTKRITFQRGVLRFSPGSILPEIDLLATAPASDATLQVHVEGSPTNPKITFSSSPELPQDEVLARLLFNEPSGKLSPFQLAQIAQLVAGQTGLVDGSGGGIFDRIRKFLALDQLGVGSGDTNSTSTNTAGNSSSSPALQAGRYIGQGVYVGVQQGTDAGSSRVQVQVDVAPRLKLEAGTGTSTAGQRLGLSYEYEY